MKMIIKKSLKMIGILQKKRIATTVLILYLSTGSCCFSSERFLLSRARKRKQTGIYEDFFFTSLFGFVRKTVKGKGK